MENKETPSSKYYVKYRVAGFEGEQQAGPYDLEGAKRHRADIRTYEGVTNCRIETAKEEQNG